VTAPGCHGQAQRAENADYTLTPRRDDLDAEGAQIAHFGIMGHAIVLRPS
jgi:hypothetical protein